MKKQSLNKEKSMEKDEGKEGNKKQGTNWKNEERGVRRNERNEGKESEEVKPMEFFFFSVYLTLVF